MHDHQDLCRSTFLTRRPRTRHYCQQLAGHRGRHCCGLPDNPHGRHCSTTWTTAQADTPPAWT